MTNGSTTCAHTPAGPPPTPRAAGCEECLATGGRWLHLRLCLSCGHVGCCDSSPGRHATKHFRSAHHPVIQSFEPGETWGWCYLEERELGPFSPMR
ncbi:MAG: UBP-type zinc finger domain-containing protein [Gemmatimonadales bacterium]